MAHDTFWAHLARAEQPCVNPERHQVQFPVHDPQDVMDWQVSAIEQFVTSGVFLAHSTVLQADEVAPSHQ